MTESSQGQAWRSWFLGLQGFTEGEGEGPRFQKEERGLSGWAHTCAQCCAWFNRVCVCGPAVSVCQHLSVIYRVH